jgi:hypothetical protein
MPLLTISKTQLDKLRHDVRQTAMEPRRVAVMFPSHVSTNGILCILKANHGRADDPVAMAHTNLLQECLPIATSLGKDKHKRFTLFTRYAFEAFPALAGRRDFYGEGNDLAYMSAHDFAEAYADVIEGKSDDLHTVGRLFLVHARHARAAQVVKLANAVRDLVGKRARVVADPSNHADKAQLAACLKDMDMAIDRLVNSGLNKLAVRHDTVDDDAYDALMEGEEMPKEGEARMALLYRVAARV